MLPVEVATRLAEVAVGLLEVAIRALSTSAILSSEDENLGRVARLLVICK